METDEIKFGNYGKNIIKLEKKIGEGSYGEVFKGYINYPNSNSILVAIKKIKNTYNNDLIDPTTLREISLLKKLNHPNIIKLLDIVIDDDLYLIFEYLDFNLNQFLNKEKKNYLKKGFIKYILFNILKGLSYLHSNQIIHRDLKPSNILISQDGKNIKICNFGMSRKINFYNRQYSQNVSTLFYSPPELLLGMTDYMIYKS